MLLLQSKLADDRSIFLFRCNKTFAPRGFPVVGDYPKACAAHNFIP